MYWHSRTQLKTVALSAAVLLFAAGSAVAQHGHGGGHGGGGHGGGGSHGGGGFHGAIHSGGFHSSGFHGAAHGGTVHTAPYRGFHSSFHHGVSGYHHNAYRPGHFGYRHYGYRPFYSYYPYYYTPFYSSYYGYSPGSYYYYSPSYYSSYYTPDYSNDVETYDYGYPETYTPYSYYPPSEVEESTAPADTRAHLRLIVPADAEVWFEGDRTAQTGSTREFVSPALTPGVDYSYSIRARWLENGQVVDQTRKVTVGAGAWITVDFTQPPTSR
jgi:uncharacterized protein (TIGR03000 family)